MKGWNRTLRGQITALTLFIIAFLFLLIGVLQFAFMKDFLYNNKADALHAQIRSWPPEPAFLSKNGAVKEWGPPGERAPNRPIIFQPGMIVSLIGANGEQTMLSDHTVEAAPIISELQYADIFEQYRLDKAKRFYEFSDAEGNDYMVLFREMGGHMSSGDMLQVSIELESLKKQLYTQLCIYIIAALFALLAGSVLTLISLRKALMPLHQMIAAVEQTNAENLTEQLPAMQQQELDQLAAAYNDMLARLETAFESERMTSERMRQFIADASHELRTPITSIHGFIEVLQRGAMKQPKQLELSLKAMEQESTRMKTLVESLLQLAKLDQPDHEQMLDDFQRLQLPPLIKGMLLQLELMAGKRKITLEYNGSERYEIWGSPHGIKQILLNLISNAIQHTDSEHGLIAIRLLQRGSLVMLAVSDNGTGIAKEHQQQLFERFFRIDKARTRAAGGAGLGLSITKRLVEAHQAHIEVESELGSGSTFTISFPLLQAHADESSR